MPNFRLLVQIKAIPNLPSKPWTEQGCVMQTHKRDLTITAILCMDGSLMEIILLTLFVDEVYSTSTKVILLCFGDVKEIHLHT